jgi:hypothetical protein
MKRADPSKKNFDHVWKNLDNFRAHPLVESNRTFILTSRTGMSPPLTFIAAAEEQFGEVIVGETEVEG